MSHRGLNRILGKLYQTGSVNPPRTAHQDELEHRLRAKFQAQHTHNRNWYQLFNPWNRTARFAMIGLAMFMLGLGACTTSTITEVEMGQRVIIDIAPEPLADIVAVNEEMKAFFATRPDIDQTSTSYNTGPNGATTFYILVWGSNLNETQLQASLRSEITALSQAHITTEPLTGTVKETLASKFKRQVFKFEINGTTEEEIRSQILTQLAAQGNLEGTEVDVKFNNGQTEINITVEEELED